MGLVFRHTRVRLFLRDVLAAPDIFPTDPNASPAVFSAATCPLPSVCVCVCIISCGTHESTYAYNSEPRANNVVRTCNKKISPSITLMIILTSKSLFGGVLSSPEFSSALAALFRLCMAVFVCTRDSQCISGMPTHRDKQAIPAIYNNKNMHTERTWRFISFVYSNSSIKSCTPAHTTHCHP